MLREVESLDHAGLAAVLSAAASRLAAMCENAAVVDEPTPADDDVLLTIKEIAPRVGKSVGWLYHNWRTLPFAVQGIGGTPRFSKNGLDKYIAKRQNACK